MNQKQIQSLINHRFPKKRSDRSQNYLQTSEWPFKQRGVQFYARLSKFYAFIPFGQQNQFKLHLCSDGQFRVARPYDTIAFETREERLRILRGTTIPNTTY